MVGGIHKIDAVEDNHLVLDGRERLQDTAAVESELIGASSWTPVLVDGAIGREEYRKSTRWF